MSKSIGPARGMRDFLSSDKRKREKAIGKIRQVYRSFGYEEIETPALENIDRLLGSEGGENLNMLFKVLKRGLPAKELIELENAVDLGLRYDLTLPLARFYASNMGKLPSVFRTVQIGPVWRAERPQKGRFRQFTQCDIDIIGMADERAEVELIAITLLALEALKISNVTVRLNDRQLLVSILDAFNFSREVHSTVLIGIDKIDKIGVAGVSEELSSRLPDAGDSIKPLILFLQEACAIVEQGGDSFETIPPILPPGVDSSLVDTLQSIAKNVMEGLPSACIRLDPTLVRGMGYYTGPIFEIEVDGVGNSIAGGGRYDGMIGRFCNKSIPACGFSLGFERLVELLDEGLAIRPKRLAMFYDPGIEPGALLRMQRELVGLGYEVTPIVPPKKIGKAIQRAANDGFGSFVEIASPDQKIVEDDIRTTTKGPE